MTTKTARLVALVAVTTSIMLSVTVGEGNAADRKVIILQAITGAASASGEPAAKAMNLAVDDLNARRFLGEDRLVAEVVDSASARAQSMAAVTRYAADPDVLIVVGPTSAVEAVPAAGVANEAKIPLMAYSNATDILKAGPWSFISNQPGTVTMPQLGDYVLQRIKPKTCATIRHTDNQSFVGLEQTFVEYTQPKALTFVDRSGVLTTDTDFSAIATRVVAAKPDCVLLFVQAPPAANIAIQLKQAGLPANSRLIGQTAVASPQLMTIGGEAVEGLVLNADWVPGGASPEGKMFAEEFMKTYGKGADNFAALGYAFMQVAATAIKNASPGPTREKVRAALANSKDVPVVVGDGKYSYNTDRLPTYGSVFMQVKNGQFQVVPR